MQNDVRVLVTGAGGFIGHHLVRALKADGYWVRGVDIKAPEFEPSSADEFEPRFGGAKSSAQPNQRGKGGVVGELMSLAEQCLDVLLRKMNVVCGNLDEKRLLLLRFQHPRDVGAA